MFEIGALLRNRANFFLCELLVGNGVKSWVETDCSEDFLTLELVQFGDMLLEIEARFIARSGHVEMLWLRSLLGT